MKTHSAQNERIKRAYLNFLKEAQGYNDATLDGVAKSLNRFEVYTRFKDFKSFHIEQDKGFKLSLSGEFGQRSGKPLSKAIGKAIGAAFFWA